MNRTFDKRQALLSECRVFAGKGCDAGKVAIDAIASRKRAHLNRIVQLVTSGAVRLPQITSYALADAQAEYRVSEGRHLRGGVQGAVAD